MLSVVLKGVLAGIFYLPPAFPQGVGLSCHARSEAKRLCLQPLGKIYGKEWGREAVRLLGAGKPALQLPLSPVLNGQRAALVGEVKADAGLLRCLLGCGCGQ